ncbi:Protein kinase domain containing protein [Gracilaria domingensis]|nr:Protein kinase domain containing protein [Gracilaria domingensis]
MEVVECGTVTLKGGIKHDIAFFSNGKELFVAPVPKHVWRDLESKLHTLDAELVNLDRVYPLFDPDKFTQAPIPVPVTWHRKQPCLLDYPFIDKTSNRICEAAKHEALLCEALKDSPHPNIAKYHGCEVKNGRIVALFFQRYEITLHDLVEASPGQVDKHRCLRELSSAVDHLHRLGYAHNDLNPRNIMYDDNGTAIIIDFDSSRQIGHKLGNKRGTQMFYDKSSYVSVAENDYYSLRMIDKYLNEKCTTSISVKNSASRGETS